MSTATSRLLGFTVILTCLFWRPPRRWLDVLLVGVIVTDLTLAGKALLLTIAPTELGARSPIVDGAIRLQGRIFERAGKDLDTTIHGVRGQYPSNDVRHLAKAQARQAWALSGAERGLCYAYDRSPDGSYSWRNHVLQTRLETASWAGRVKWLRAAAVAGVIASNVPEPLQGLIPLVHDNDIGVPVTLYAVTPRLSELRVPERVRWVQDPEEAIDVIEQADFDETREITAEGRAIQTAPATVRLLRETPDEIIFRSEAGGPSLAFVARSYTRRVVATTKGRALRVWPANVHLCAIEIPPGVHQVVVTF